MAVVKIFDNSYRVGAVTFDEQPSRLQAERTATGFNLRIPAQIGLKSAPEGEPQVALKNLRLTFSIESASGIMLELGRLQDEHKHSAFITYHGEQATEQAKELDLVWAATIPALIAIENARKHMPPRLHITLRAELCYIIICQQWQNHGLSEQKRFPVFTVPQRITEQTDVTYPVEIWQVMADKVLADSHNDPLMMLLPLKALLVGRTE